MSVDGKADSEASAHVGDRLQGGDPLSEHAPSPRGNSSPAGAPRGGRLPMVVFARPRCPRCGSARLRKHRSIADQGDGSALWWVRCDDRACGHRFKVLLE
jgi:hypothetical protein